MDGKLKAIFKGVKSTNTATKRFGIIKLLLALQRAMIAAENDASKCVETFCYTISTILGCHLSVKIVPRPNLQCFKVYWQPLWATDFAVAKKIGITPT